MSAALFGHTSQHTSRNLVEFRAGRMTLRDKTVTADNRKGLFYITAGEDGLLHVCWKERNSSSTEMDLNVVPDECDFTRVTQCKTGRVFLLRFKASPSRKHFFWLQEPSEKKDADLEKKVQDLLRDGVPARSGAASGAASALGGLDDSELHRAIMQDPAQFMQLMSTMGLADAFRTGLPSGPPTQRGTPQPSARGARARAVQPAAAAAAAAAASSSSSSAAAAATTTTAQTQAETATTAAAAGSSKGGKVQFKLADLESALSTLRAAGSSASGEGEGDGFEFASILRPEELAKLLENETVRQRLAPLLPEAERAQLASVSSAQQARELADVLRSPQFRQALNAFGEALRSGQLGPVLTQFGLPTAVANSAATGSATEFAQALQAALSQTASSSTSTSQSQPAKPKQEDAKKDEAPKKSDDDKMDHD